MTNGERRKVLLVDDHEVVRRGLRLLLETEFDYEVIEGGTAEEAVSLSKDEDIDLALLDVRLGERDGMWALGKIRERSDLPVVMLSTFASEEYVDASIEAGANGYVLKDATLHQFRDAIDTAVERRGLYLHPAVAQRLLMRRRATESVDALTDREQRILDMLVEGSTNEQMANALFLSEKTVKSHLSSIFRKLDVINRTQAVSKAIREGIVKLPERATA